MFLIAEFLHMITASFLIVILFFGGWHLPLMTGDPATKSIGWATAIVRILVLLAKVFARDRVLHVGPLELAAVPLRPAHEPGWKVMLPLGLVNLVALAILYEARQSNDPQQLGARLDGWPFWSVRWRSRVIVAVVDQSAAGTNPLRVPTIAHAAWQRN